MIDQATRSFIWNGRLGTRSLHLVSWNKVARPKHLGGLGIRDARWMNVAFLGKLVWHLLIDDGGFWGTILCHKYVPTDGPCMFSMR